MNVRFNYRYLVGLCLAAASFPALSAIRDAPIKLGDTTYFEVERGVKLKGGELAKYQQNTMKLLPNEREIYQRQTSKIVVDAHKVSAPVEVSSKWGAPKVQKAFKSGLKTVLTRGNGYFLAGMIAYESLQYLLDTADWTLDEKTGDIVVIKEDSFIDPSGSDRWSCMFNHCYYSCQSTSTNTTVSCVSNSILKSFPDAIISVSYSFNNNKATLGVTASSPAGSALDSSWFTRKTQAQKVSETLPLDFSDNSLIDNLDLSSYKPKEKDIPFLSNYLGTPDEIKFSNISEFQGESKTFTVTDENGDTITKQVNTWHNFAVSPSTVTPSSGDPKLEVSTKTQTDTYKDGQKTSSKTETETTKPSDNEDKPTFVGGGGSGKETPTDCAFFPTLCKWLDWTQEDVGDEPDLDKIINDADDFEREYKITGGAASCPAPYKLTIPFFAKTFDVSYQPFCDFATYLRYLFLAFCYFTAARYVVRSI